MPVRIIGVDPGLRRTGWGIVIADGSRLIHGGEGVITPDPGAAMADRLLALFRGLGEVVAAHSPDEAAVEQTFVNRDAASSLKLGQARGAGLLALAAAGLACAEYAPNLVKKSVVGRGHADKVQISAMVSMLLGIGAISSRDATDALAVAITHAHHRASAALQLT